MAGLISGKMNKKDLVVAEWTGERWIYPANASEGKLTIESLTKLEISKIRTKVNEICAKQ